VGRYTLAQRFYREAARLNPEDADLVFLLGDALLLSGAVGEALACFDAALSRGAAPRLLMEASLKKIMCEHLLATARSDIIPRAGQRRIRSCA
jgi:tetratricopeptide (TPR) repeat protein